MHFALALIWNCRCIAVPVGAQAAALVEEQVGVRGVDGLAGVDLAARRVVVAEPRARRVARVRHVVPARQLPRVRLRTRVTRHTSHITHHTWSELQITKSRVLILVVS
jgi:S-adenosylmethionine/arginine decarboxylase-like enzyme